MAQKTNDVDDCQRLSTKPVAHDTIKITDDVVEMVRNQDKREIIIPLDSVDWDLTETPLKVTLEGETDEITVGITSAQMMLLGELTGNIREECGYGPFSSGMQNWIAEWEGRTGVEWDEPEIFNFEAIRLRFDNHGG